MPAKPALRRPWDPQCFGCFRVVFEGLGFRVVFKGLVGILWGFNLRVVCQGLAGISYLRLKPESSELLAGFEGRVLLFHMPSVLDEVSLKEL